MPDDVALSADERAELERLRAEVADLRSQVSTVAAVLTDQTVVPTPRPRRQWWRSVVATLLIVVGCILAPLSVVAVWTKNLVTDTDRYVATVAPLADDPVIQNTVADKITAEIFAHLDVAGITNQAVDALAERGLASAHRNPTARALRAVVQRGAELRPNRGWAMWWPAMPSPTPGSTANRAAHTALVAALTGQTGEGVTIENDTVSINLGPFIQVVKQRLIDRGFELASRIPDVNPSFMLVHPMPSPEARGAFNLLNTIGNWLPIIALIFLALGVYVAKGHRRALVGAGLGLAGGMLALGLGIALFRTIYLNAIPADVLPHDAAAAFYDTLVRFLRLGLRTVLVFGLIVALAGVPHRPLNHRRPDSGRAEQRYRLAARRCRKGRLPHRSRWAPGSTPTSECLDRYLDSSA